MKVLILAAGKGSRLNSEAADLPKVLREVASQPLLIHLLNQLDFIAKEDIHIVVGYQAEKVQERIGSDFHYVLQLEQLGTGHAVQSATDQLADYQGDLLVLYGDMPLLTKRTLQEFVASHQKSAADCTLMTGVFATPPAYGRIIRNANGEFVDIVEQKDCSAEQLLIKEVNVGLYVFNNQPMLKNLGALQNRNAQKEYYLTDLPKIMLNNGLKINTYQLKDNQESAGVNTLEDLIFCENVLTKG